jgi:acyl carrier protein
MSQEFNVKPTKTLTMLHAEIQAYFAQSSDTSPDMIELNTDLISEGFLDSLSLARFIMFIEETLGNEIGFEDFDIAHISSVSAIYDQFVL